MAIVRIQINGKEYDIACDDGQEEHLRLLADDVDERVRALIMGAGVNPGEVMSLLLTSLTMSDEILENKKLLQQHNEPADDRTSAAERLRQERRIVEMEAAMATTLDDVAKRIEKIAEQIEIG